VKCVIVQPSYMPWRGHFDLVRQADVFVFYDDVQYDKHGWRNRNRVKTPNGVEWLTIPVHGRGATQGLRTADVRIDSVAPWPRKHFATLRQLYARAPHFDEYRPWLERLYASPPAMLADFTVATTIELAAMLGITSTRFLRSSELGIEGRKTDRLLAILQRLGADEYLSGPSARHYIEPERFAAAGIALHYVEYDYPEYPQLYPPFEPHVSVLDLLFMTGMEAPRYIWGLS
jgi:hypothetical protein